MKIWILGRSYPSISNNMRGTFELEQAKMLAKRGNEVTYISVVLHPFKKIGKWGFNHFVDESVQVYSYSLFFAPERMHLHIGALNYYLWANLLEKIENDRGFPEIIHVHYPGMVGNAKLLTMYRNRGVKLIITEHWSKVLNNTMDEFQRKQLVEMVSISDGIICVSKLLRNALIKICDPKCLVNIVPNIVPELKVKASEKKENDFSFIVVGRLEKVKQIYECVMAFIEEFDEENDVKMHIVGDGKDRKKIEKIIRDKGADKKVVLMGTRSRKETIDLINESDSLVCFSKLETFGVPVIEAWYCGKPVIASDAVAVVDVWDDKLGMHIAKNDVKDLKNAMRDMYKKRQCYDETYISNFAKANYSEEIICDKLLEVYRLCCN